MLAKASIHRAAGINLPEGSACGAVDAGLRQHDGEKKGWRMAKPGWVYLMASAPRGTLYLGVTSNLMNRVQQHRTGHFEGFTSRYDVKQIVWNEQYPDIADAIRREKAMKFWKREWKIRLIEESNPHWLDLAVDWGFPPLRD